MPKEIRVNTPREAVDELKRCSKEIRRTVQTVELAAERAFKTFRFLKFGPEYQHVPAALATVERLDRAHSQLGDARTALDDAAYQVKKVLESFTQE